MIFNPIYEFERMRSLLDDLMLTTSSPAYKNEEFELTNAYENEGGYMLQFLAPGVKLENIAVNFENGILSVSIKRNLERDMEKDKKIIRNERASLDFTRSYHISENADIDKIEAKMINGLLMVHIPKRESAKPKKITVKVK